MKYLFSSLFLCICLVSGAQNITGKWQGIIKAGGQQLRFIMNLSKTAGGYKTSFDSPDQNVYNLDGTNTIVSNDSIIAEIAVTHGGYRGKWDGKDGMTGVFIQGATTIVLPMQRLTVEASAKASPDPVSSNRPQTPKPPFTYDAVDVEYDNADKTIHYGATLTKPRGVKSFPTAIIISGSGSQDRDGTVMGHKFYAVLADYLTNQGIGVLRVDDRGTGKSSIGNDIAGLTSVSFAKDVEASLDYLLSRSDLDKKKIGLIGHSEGGIIAPMVAARRKEVSFIILWGAPAVGGAQIITEQNEYNLQQAGVDDNSLAAFSQVFRAVLNQFATTTKEGLNNKVINLFSEWKAKQTKETISALHVTDSSFVGENVYKMFHSLYDLAWLRFFITYDPATDLSKVKCPVLAINGSKDTQVGAKENLALIKNILTNSGNKQVQTNSLASLNHFLQTAVTGDLSEYEKIEETMSPVALSLIAGWIKDQIR